GTFGDGSAVSTLQNPTHTYQSSGTFSYSLAVSDASSGRATASGTVSAVIPPLRFLETDVSWSGAGNLDIALAPTTGGQVVPNTRVDAGCEATTNRTERKVFSSVPAGTYNVTVSALTCGAGTPATITGIVSAIS